MLKNDYSHKKSTRLQPEKKIDRSCDSAVKKKEVWDAINAFLQTFVMLQFVMLK